MAFFSGTDENTLISEGSDLNHFLSLIVCNAGQYVARITRKLKTKIKADAHIVYTKSIEYETYENQTVVLASNEINEVDKSEERSQMVIEYFELQINKASVEEPFKELDERLEEIKLNKKKAYKYGGSYVSSQILDVHGNSYGGYYQSKLEENEEASEAGVDKSKQLTLFGKPEEEVTETQEESITEFYQLERVPQKITNTLCTQLLFGSILANGDANIDLAKFVKKMDKTYEKRFGNLTNEFNYLRLSNWIDMFLEQLIGYSVDTDYEDKIAKKYNLGNDYDYEESDSFIHLYAHNMIIFLYKLPESDVKDMMIESLITLMPRDYVK